MDKEHQNSRNRQSGASDSGHYSRGRRGGYENDYAPHYSKQSPSGEGANHRARTSDTASQRRMQQKNYDTEYGTHARRPAPDSRMQQRSAYGRPEQRPVNPKHKSAKKHTVGKILACIQGILSIIVLAILFVLDILPMKYLAIAAVLLLIFWVFAFFSQFTKGTHIVGKIESVILCVILAMGTYYLAITSSFMGSITGSTIKIDNIVIAVLTSDPAQTLKDAGDYTFGIQTVMDRENVDKTIAKVNENIGKDIAVQEYDGLLSQVDALYNGEVQAIIFNEAFSGNVIEQHPTFNEDIRILDNVKFETEVKVSAADVDVTDDAFTVYITGIDTRGTISTTGRSDVNILATVNPTTRQILLTTTPRDYYVTFPGVTGGALDKLTHAGIYGVDCSMDTLGELYGIDIDYYVKVNFTSVVEIVDKLGPLEVYSECAFTSIYGYPFTEGMNTIESGEEALAFARERKNLPGGDNQRGKNQQALITAMIKKAMSPAILVNYAGILGSIDGNFETSMSMNDITELIKMQLDGGGDWNIVSQNVVGSNGEDVCYSLPDYGPVYVMIPDMSSVEAAKAQIAKVYQGETLENVPAAQ